MVLSSEAEEFYFSGKPVFDAAGFLDQSTEDELNQTLYQVWQKGGPQLMIITLADLSGRTIEEVSIDLADKVKLGKHREDKGVLLVVAKAEKKMRIEVGDGLEGNLTDLTSKRIIDYIIVPQFRQGQFSSGIRDGALAIIQKAEPDKNYLEGVKLNQNINSFSLSSHFPIIIFLIWLIVMLVISRWAAKDPNRAYYAGRRGRYSSYGSGSDWMGGGGGSSGGYSGGGGSFSGGGASGGW